MVDQILFIKQPEEGKPSILLIVDGMGVYILTHLINSSPAKDAIAKYCEQLLGPITCLFNWSAGRLAFHELIVDERLGESEEDKYQG